MRSPRRRNQSPTALLARHLAFCCIWVQAIVTCSVLAETHQERLPVFRVDTQGLTPHEIGTELGRQWKSRFPGLESKLDALLAQRLEQTPSSYEAVDRSFPAMPETGSGGLAQDHLQELEGLASALHLVGRNRLGDGFLSRDELLLIQRLPDLGAQDSGSAFGVYGSRSNTGGPLVGRNLDRKPKQGRLERSLDSITVYRGEGRALVNIGFAGNLGITTGFNQSGLLLAYLPASGMSNQGVADAASEPIAFAIRRMLEAHEHIDSAARALSGRTDTRNYSVLMADRKRVSVLEHAAGIPGRRREALSELQPAMSWGHEQQLAAVGCFALSTMPTGCSSLRDRYRWQRFRALATPDRQSPRFKIGDIVQIMLDRVGSPHAIYSATTYQTLAFAPDSAALYLGTESPTASDPVEPVMHRYADLIGESAQKSGGVGILWLLLWLLIVGISIATLWVRLRLGRIQK